MIKLPKQWRHWCRKYGLRPMRGSDVRKEFSWWYLQGRGRVWRVTDSESFEGGDLIKDFDRWALCDPIARIAIPENEYDFKDALQWMAIYLTGETNLNQVEEICNVE